MKRTIEFLKFRWIAFIISLSLIMVFAAGTVIKGGFNFGVDFVGGVKIIAKFEKGISEKKIRDTLEDFNPMVQQIGQEDKNEYIISTKLSGNKETAERDAQEVKTRLTSNFSNVEFQSEESVGPAIGNFLKKSALKLFIVALVLMSLYLAFRFEIRYSLGAMSALVHDIGITILFCGSTGIEFSIPVVAALLTIFGYSVNDTIVVFDRIRENIQMKSKQSLIDIINQSISQSFSRTMLTSLTTLFTVLALYLLGGEGLVDFAQVLLFGIFVGTYSSIYIASPVVLAWDRYIAKK